MKVDLDPEYLRMSMTMWRDTVDMKLPMLDEFKVHFMRQRRTILTNFSSTAGAWLTVLRRCEAEGADQETLRVLIADVTAFKEWAESSMEQLDQLGVQEALTDQIQRFLSGPRGEA
jgi:hypothetical protein